VTVVRVLHVTQPVTGGVGQCVADLVADQRAAGLQVAVAATLDAAPGPLTGLVDLPWSATREPGRTVPREVVELRRTIRAFAPDLVHLHSSKAGLCGRLALRGRLPTVFQPHAWSFEAVSGPHGSAARAWERLASRWADRVLCVSEAERLVGVRAGVQGRQVVLANGVDVTGIRVVGPQERRAVRAELGLADAPTVVCVGRLARQKGQQTLLAAWPAVREAVPDARLVLVGDGPDLELLAQALPPHAQLVGPARDSAPWIAAADVVAVPSHWEAMALVVLEAMAGARSVVASDVGAARECLAGGAGVTVPPGDAPALAAALVARLRDPLRCAAEGAQARRAAEARFDLAVTAPHVRELYADVLSRRARMG
jgi:glycosyltransferase involved in cell wall biosynthesis